LAIARLESLPESPERSKLLAETYMEQGNLTFDQDPPQIESAIEAYNNAVRHNPDNAEYGYALGIAYLTISREKKDDTTTAEHYLDLARQTFQAVLDRNPDHVGSLDGLSRVAVLQRDNVTAANSWRRIIQVAPDSFEAERARNNLKSLNYKY
jgi:cytochrome c-type biogenesis protein CcmH/NrfG